MIPIRKAAAPPELAEVEAVQLAHLRALGHAPGAEEIVGYAIARRHLHRLQHYKCCYCERKCPADFHDVEHYRPKAEADRRPGCDERHGYWWLAFAWDNLLFSCPICNRSGKKNRFPLAAGSVALLPEELPPGREVPLLLNPATDHPAHHIRFVLAPANHNTPAGWHAEPYANSAMGEASIRVLKLNTPGQIEARADHVNTHLSAILQTLLAHQDNSAYFRHGFKHALRCFGWDYPFALLSYDGLQHFIPPNLLTANGVRWPDRAEVGSRSSADWAELAKDYHLPRRKA